MRYNLKYFVKIFFSLSFLLLFILSNNCLAICGANVRLDGKRIANVGNPTDNSDLANKQYFDEELLKAAYTIVKISLTSASLSQEWLGRNMNRGTRVASGYTGWQNNQTEKYCYNNNDNFCIIYGGLYTWSEAVDIPTTTTVEATEGSQGICPEGWHIPTKAEVQLLIDNLSNLAAQDNFSNSVLWFEQRFSTKNGGRYILSGSGNGFLYNELVDTTNSSSWAFWTSTVDSATGEVYVFYKDTSGTIKIDKRNKEFGLAVRCIKNSS